MKLASIVLAVLCSTLALGQIPKGMSFPAGDGCNSCVSMDSHFAACTLMACVPAAQAPAAASTPAPLPQNVYAAGLAYNGSASPEIAGTALYAHLLNADSKTYGFTHFDALPDTTGPQFRVQTAVGAGVAQQVFTLGNVRFYVPAGAGVAWQGSNLGWQWNSGVLASIRIKGNIYAYPAVRVLKSNLDNSGVQPILEVMFGWGK